MKRSVLLRLLRHGCNTCELAFVAGVSELDMAYRIALLQRTVKRRLRRVESPRETKLRELRQFFARTIAVPLL